MLRVIVCGGRDFNNYDDLEDYLNVFWRAYGDFIIISGCAKGADSLAIKYAEEYNNPVEKYPADWEKHGKAAGPIRNQQMLNTGVNYVIAFPGGRGTAHMVSIAKKAGVTVLEIPK